MFSNKKDSNKLLLYNFFAIMSESDSIDQLYCQRYDVNYFHPSHSQDDKGVSMKQTGLIEQVFEQLNMSYSQKYAEEEEIEKQVCPPNSRPNQQTEPSIARPKKIISVGQKFRSGYMKSKKGDNEQTNDLSINVCTLIRSFCDEYETFQPVQQEEAQLINQFKNGKSNLSAIRKIMANSEKVSEKEVNLFCNRGPVSTNPLRQYFANRLQDPQVLADLLRSRKMKFNNKIVLIKYMESIRKSAEFPQSFRGWKGNRP